MTNDTQQLRDFKEALLRTDDTFRQLVTEHQHLDERVNHLSCLAHRTEQQQFEEISLKKQKLALKDRIESIVRSFRERQGETQLQH